MEVEKDITGFFGKFNRRGIPFPMVRDPKLGMGSITATTFVVSSGLCTLCAILGLLSALSRYTVYFQKFADTQQAVLNAFNISLQFFVASGGFYLGRKFQRSDISADQKQNVNVVVNDLKTEVK